jgi:hypothetical protein
MRHTARIAATIRTLAATTMDPDHNEGEFYGSVDEGDGLLLVRRRSL